MYEFSVFFEWFARIGQLNRKRRYLGSIGTVKLWEFRGEKHRSITLHEINDI